MKLVVSKNAPPCLIGHTILTTLKSGDVHLSRLSRPHGEGGYEQQGETQVIFKSTWRNMITACEDSKLKSEEVELCPF